jgi:hypothetical protein
MEVFSDVVKLSCRLFSIIMAATHSPSLQRNRQVFRECVAKPHAQRNSPMRNEMILEI